MYGDIRYRTSDDSVLRGAYPSIIIEKLVFNSHAMYITLHLSHVTLD